MDYLGSRWMETAPTSIEVLLRPTLGQSDELSDLRGSLSPTSVYSTWQSPGGHPSNYEPGATSPNFSDRANHDERTPYSVYKHEIVFLIIPLKFNLPQNYHSTVGAYTINPWTFSRWRIFSLCGKDFNAIVFY